MKTADKIKQLRKIFQKVKKQLIRQEDAQVKINRFCHKSAEITNSIKGSDRELYAEQIKKYSFAKGTGLQA